MSVAGYSVKPLSEKDKKTLDKAFCVQDALVEFHPGRLLLPPIHANYQQQILDAPVREDDVWLISYPRTGSTWCQEMIWLLVNNLDFEASKATIQQIRAPLIEMSTFLSVFANGICNLVDNSVEYVNQMTSPRCIKSHLPYELLPTQLDKVKPKIVYTCRDPKDMSVSYYFHCKTAYNLDIPYEEFAELIMQGLAPIGEVFPHYLTYWNKRNDSNVLFLKYEDMKKDLKGTLKKLTEFLEKDYSDEQIDSLCDFLNFKKMRDNKGCNLEVLLDEHNGQHLMKNIGDHFIRKGEVGDWKNHMSPELAERFNNWIENNTKGTGLSW